MKEFLLKLLRTFSIRYFKRFKILFEKPRLTVFIILNFLILWGLPLFHPVMFIPVLILTGMLFIIALSDWLEWLLRRLEDARRIATKKEKKQLLNLFDSVLAETDIEQNVKLYIIDSAKVNALAIGRTTVAINRGTMEHMDDSQLSGIIAHELGHIANGDTIIQNVILVYTFLYFFAFYIARFIVAFLENLFQSNLLGEIFGLLGKVFDFFFKVLYFICNAIICGSWRKEEYQADKFAHYISYGHELTSALYVLYDMEISDKKKLTEQMQASHPKTAYRIERLEELQEE